MRQQLNYFKETPSQTAGPYVHIGLAPGAAGCGIYDKELGWDTCGPNVQGQRIRIEGIYAHPEHADDVEEGFRGWGFEASSPVRS